MTRFPTFLPDLSLWHSRNLERGSLPKAWRLWSLADICRDLGVGAWLATRPWRLEYDGIDYRETQDATSRVRSWDCPEGRVEARWVLGPDGDWWQSEYPVKTAADLPIVARVLGARRYVIDGEVTVPKASPEAGLYPALELPMHPWSEILHSFLGWTEGFMIALDEPERVGELSSILQEHHAALLAELVASPCETFLSPDNLDGNFIPPDTFEESMAPFYSRTADFLHAKGKSLVVHVGGNSRGLIAALGASGVDCVEGVSGPPQGDASIPEARALCGGGMRLWGGLAQDWLLPGSSEADFRAACELALAEVRSDGQSVLGVADRVPADAVVDRLRYLAALSR